jgi:hypothetical protein
MPETPLVPLAPPAPSSSPLRAPSTRAGCDPGKCRVERIEVERQGGAAAKFRDGFEPAIAATAEVAHDQDAERLTAGTRRSAGVASTTEVHLESDSSRHVAPCSCVASFLKFLAGL